MKSKKNLFKIAILSTVFTIGIGTAFIQNTSPSRAQATQYLDDYAPYTYSGNYYEDINFDAAGGMNGKLRMDLAELITPAAFYTYSGKGTGTLSEILQEADEDPNNHNNMVYLYTRDSVAKNPANTWNREHCWPQSRSNGNWGEKKGGTDILHLRPTYSSSNSSRGNKPYGDNNKQGANYLSSNGMIYGYSAGSEYFEPLDQVKGDVARIIMYVWTTYNNYPGYSSLNLLNVFDSYDTLLKWHTMDRPDALEGHRNDVSESSKQKNRNPFVDHPELGWKIFGDNASTAVKNACMVAYPYNSGTPITPTGISLNKSSATVEINKTLQLNATLEPSGATGSISWSSSNTDVAIVGNSGLVTAKGTGTTIITATCSTFSAFCTITVPEGINYGTLANPLTIEQAKEVIDITGETTTSEPLFVRGKVYSNTAFKSQYSNYDEIWLKSDDESVNKAFELYRCKLSSLITGDYTDVNSMTGCEVVAQGYGVKYKGTTYELTTKSGGSPSSPTILSLVTPYATNIELDKNNLELEVGQTSDLIATLTPANSSSEITWESANESIATVDNGEVTAVAVGTTTVTAKVSDSIKAQCTVVVTQTTTTGGDMVLASSIAIGDIVCLTCNEYNVQYAGPSSSAANAYGTYESFTEKPDENVSSFEVCTGSADGSFAFKIVTGSYQDYYLGFNSTSNSLRVLNEISNYSSWNVNIDSSNNAYISLVDDSARVIWWNNSSPRFAAYSDKDASATFHRVQLWKSTKTIEYDIDTLIATTSTFATLEADEVTNTSGVSNGSIVFEDLNLDDAADISSVNIGTNVIMTATKETGSNGPKYYVSDLSFRTYGGNKITFASSSNDITEITFTFVSGYSTGLSTSTGTYNSGSWTGSASSIEFSVTNKIRITSITVKTGSSVTTVSNVAMRFCGSMPKSAWNYIAKKWTISDYGIMMAKKTTLNDKYHVTTIKEAFLDNQKLTVKSKGSGDAPSSGGDYYAFNSRVTVGNPNQYDLTIRFAPFIVIDDVTYFFDELEMNVNDLATYYKTHEGCNLSSAALTILATPPQGE